MTPEQKPKSFDMPMFRMTDPVTGTTGILKVKKDSKGNWRIPNPETEKEYFRQMAQSLK
jgi:hypothetical protein